MQNPLAEWQKWHNDFQQMAAALWAQNIKLKANIMVDGGKEKTEDLRSTLFKCVRFP